MDFTNDSATVEEEAPDIKAWYPIFSKHTIKTRIMELPDRFSSYLLEDGIVLPDSVGRHALGNDMLSDDEDEACPAEAGSAESTTPPTFDEVDRWIQSTLDDFGGKIMVKINDKAPTDALWMNCGTLMCNSLASVYMLLKASERVGESLQDSDNYLVIRKWANMFPSMEFRCFISGSNMIGICQKDVSTFYPFLSGDCLRIQDVILDFFEESIKEKLPTPSIVMDVYVDKQDRVWIVGFSAFGDTTETDALLFTWSELTSDAPREDCDIIRVVKEESAVLPRNSSVGASRGPSDF
ncbi:unnamed protein product, partial [Ectocarpus fasciculatus]